MRGDQWLMRKHVSRSRIRKVWEDTGRSEPLRFSPSDGERTTRARPAPSLPNQPPLQPCRSAPIMPAVHPGGTTPLVARDVSTHDRTERATTSWPRSRTSKATSHAPTRKMSESVSRAPAGCRRRQSIRSGPITEQVVDSNDAVSAGLQHDRGAETAEPSHGNAHL